jgi:NAD-dependent dihydropyrimidine dehydrogenase PreA subunit
MKRLFWLATLCAAAIGGLLGWRAGAFFARESFTVQLAARIAMEDSTGTAERTLESEAFRGTGRPATDLYADAGQIERRFRVGSALLGAFCGLALGVQLLGQTRTPRSRIYFIDQDDCVSCARCFLSCPRERLRLKTLGSSISTRRHGQRGDAQRNFSKILKA